MALLIGKSMQADQIPLGTTVSSYLTEAQFQAANGTSWVLDDGRSIVGSALATLTGITSLADLRGVAVRGKNNGRADGNQDPDGERAIGSFQSHSNASHNHGGATGSHGHSVTNTDDTNFRLIRVNAAGGVGATGGNYTTIAPGSVLSAANNTAPIGSDGGNESRMKNVALNRFVKINY